MESYGLVLASVTQVAYVSKVGHTLFNSNVPFLFNYVGVVRGDWRDLSGQATLRLPYISGPLALELCMG